jgi:TatD DNase family protein
VAALVDTHAHLDDERFAADLPAVLGRAREAGVLHILTVATTARSSAVSVELARQHPALFATVGIHPNHAAEAAPGAWDEVVDLVGRERVVALGETGLDRHWDFTPFPVQEDYFRRHLELARKHGLPVVIHCREAEADVLRLLREDFDRHGPVRGVMHSFAGDAALGEACLAMGLYVSFAGMLTYKNAGPLREVAARVPRDRLLVETDSPYLSPVPLRGRRNEPAHVVHTAAVLAGLQGMSPDDLAGQTTSNARALFGLPG